MSFYRSTLFGAACRHSTALSLSFAALLTLGAGVSQADVQMPPPLFGEEPKEAPGSSSTGQGADTQAPVDFLADNLVNDEARQLVIATGHVEFSQNGRVLKADQVQYDLTRDVVTATGNVVLLEKNGDVHFADTLELTDDMRDGFVKTLRSTLADGSRFTAKEGERKGGHVIVMKDATYTPCEPCKLDPSKPPIWQLRAGTVTHDDIEKTVSYKNARLELWGVPVAYTPYFSHPDGTIKQKSGFLTPTFKMDTQNGTSVGTRYYWGISPSQDATLGLEAYTKQAPRATLDYRQRFDTAEIELNGSTTYSERQDSSGDETVTLDAETRGHLQGKGVWDMSPTWRSGFDFNVASDDQYFRQYDVTADDVIEDQVYAERLSGRDYTSIRMMAFQDLRTSDRQTDQPNILPEIESSFVGDPGSVLGGRLALNASALGLQRNGSGADMARGTLEGGWNGRYVTGFGLVTTLDAKMRGDVYYTMDRQDSGTTTGDEIDKTRIRAFPIAQATTSMPFVKPMKTVDLLFEPIAAVTLVTNMDEDGSIPNEDSQDIQLDTSNLFEMNRFPGYDRVEDLSRTTYGVRAGVNAHDGSLAELFLGQSYRFQDDDNPFPDNSGLASQQSDIVGRLKLGYQDMVTLDYGFQLASDDLTPIRHEIDNGLHFGDFSLNTRYLFAKQIEGIGVDSSRDQIYSALTYKLDEQWSVRTSARYDLGQDSGLRVGTAGVDYTGQCVNFSVTAQRNLTNDSTGESSTELFLRVGLKNLGEFQTSGISLEQSTEDNSTSSLTTP